MAAALQILVNQVDDLVSSTTGILFPVSQLHKNIHHSLVAVAAILAVVTYFAQLKKPAPYGKHKSVAEEKKWGPKIPILLSHVTSDGPSGTLLFLFLYLQGSQHGNWTNWVFAGLFMIHAFQRGFIHPFLMIYREKSVPLFICLGAFLPNILYHSLVADWLANAVFPRHHLFTPLVNLGLVSYVGGFFINRMADWKQRQLKKKHGVDAYICPTGWLFSYIACPNYFGELVQWIGFSLATQAPASVAWLFFCAATFFARSPFNLAYYRKKFGDKYPRQRKALIPFIY